MRPHRHFQQFAFAIRLDHRRPVPSFHLRRLFNRETGSRLSSRLPGRGIPDPCPVPVLVCLCPLQHLVVRGRLILEIVRLHVILAHGMVFELRPTSICGAGRDARRRRLRTGRRSRAPETPRLCHIGVSDGSSTFSVRFSGSHAQNHRPVLLAPSKRGDTPPQDIQARVLARLFDGLFHILLDAVHHLGDLLVTFTFSAISLSGQSTPVTLDRKSKRQLGRRAETSPRPSHAPGSATANAARSGWGWKRCPPPRPAPPPISPPSSPQPSSLFF